MAYLHSNKPMNIHTYIHTFIHSYIHTFIHSYIHTFIHSYIHTFIHTFIHSYIHTFIHLYLCDNLYNPCHVCCQDGFAFFGRPNFPTKRWSPNRSQTMDLFWRVQILTWHPISDRFFAYKMRAIYPDKSFTATALLLFFKDLDLSIFFKWKKFGRVDHFSKLWKMMNVKACTLNIEWKAPRNHKQLQVEISFCSIVIHFKLCLLYICSYIGTYIHNSGLVSLDSC
jgi:hypothetical protein